MKKKETPTEKYLREILEQIKIQNSRPIIPMYTNPSPQVPFQQGYTCMLCHQYVYGQHTCTCHGGTGGTNYPYSTC